MTMEVMLVEQRSDAFLECISMQEEGKIYERFRSSYDVVCVVVFLLQFVISEDFEW